MAIPPPLQHDIRHRALESLPICALPGSSRHPNTGWAVNTRQARNNAVRCRWASCQPPKPSRGPPNVTFQNMVDSPCATRLSISPNTPPGDSRFDRLGIARWPLGVAPRSPCAKVQLGCSFRWRHNNITLSQGFQAECLRSDTRPEYLLTLWPCSR